MYPSYSVRESYEIKIKYKNKDKRTKIRNHNENTLSDFIDKKVLSQSIQNFKNIHFWF